MDDRDLSAPRGCRKDWDCCTVDARDAAYIFKEFGGDKITKARGWFDENGALRVMVAISADDKKLVFRSNTETFNITVSPPSRRMLHLG